MSWKSKRGLIFTFEWDWEDWAIGFVLDREDQRLALGGPWWTLVIQVVWRDSGASAKQRRIGFQTKGKGQE